MAEHNKSAFLLMFHLGIQLGKWDRLDMCILEEIYSDSKQMEQVMGRLFMVRKSEISRVTLGK
jgi:hypothetical protein